MSRWDEIIVDHHLSTNQGFPTYKSCFGGTYWYKVSKAPCDGNS